MADIFPAEWKLVVDFRPALAGQRQRARSMPWAAGGSLGLHAAIVVLLVLLLPAMPPLLLPKEPTVMVEILSADQLAAATTPPPIAKAPPEPLAASRPSGPAEPTPQPGAMIRAEHFFSAATLADPRSKRAREALRQLASGERVIQLCNLEALEQVHRWKPEFQPDYLMAYAMAGAKLSENAVEADGAAFRSKRHWYKIKFKCQVTPDLATVAAFEFLVGDEIPRSQWASHDLLLDDGPDD
jgi:hypothetical protein